MVFVVDMPLNIEGDGPELNPEKISEIRWQIWDADTFEFLAEYSTEEEALYQASLVNASTSSM